MNKTTEQPAKQTQRTPLGQRSQSQTAATRARIVGPQTATLDVAAFQSFAD